MSNSAKNDIKLFGIDFGENPEQRELIRLINEDWRTTPYVFCDGNAGTGKTFATLVAALNLVINCDHGDYYKIFYVREPQEVGKSLGFLPGNLDDKYGVYLEGLNDNLEHIAFFANKAGLFQNAPEVPLEKGHNSSGHKSRKEKYEERNNKMSYGNGHQSKYAAKKKAFSAVASFKERIECVPPQFVRGRSFQNAIIIVDEAQNLSFDSLQTLMTRVGGYTKMIFLGSSNQIDVPGMTKEDNDFDMAYELAKKTGFAQKVTLVKSERSECAARIDEVFTEYKTAHPDYIRSAFKNKKH